jgi:ADP-heptose:LPS heptosyltransferase
MTKSTMRWRTALAMKLPRGIRMFVFPKIVALRLATRYILFLLVDVLALAFVRRGRSGAVLVIQNASLGDYLLVRNFLASVRAYELFQGRPIVFCGNANVRALAETYDAVSIDSFVWIDQKAFDNHPWARFQVLKKLKKLGCAYVVHAFYARSLFNGDALVRAAGGGERIGMETRPHAVLPSEKMGAADYNPLWMRSIGDACYTRIVPDVSPSFEFDRYRAFFGQVLMGAPLPTRPELIPQPVSTPEIPRPFAVLLPGAGWSFREWPVERYARLAAHLHRTHGLRIVVAGTEADRPKATSIITANAGIPIDDLTGQLSLPQLVTLMEQARLIVANDSGGIHLAAALNKDAVGIASGHLFGQFHPYPPRICSSVHYAYPKFVRYGSEPFETLVARFGHIPLLPISEVEFETVVETIDMVLRGGQPRETGGVSDLSLSNPPGLSSPLLQTSCPANQMPGTP